MSTWEPTFVLDMVATRRYNSLMPNRDSICSVQKHVLAGLSCPLSLGVLLFTAVCHGQWAAFNDHVPGTIGSQTHPNATTLKIPAVGGASSASVLLRDISTGTNVNVTLTISRSSGGVTYNPNGGLPAGGTPLYNTFTGFVYFGTATDCNVELSNSLGGTITYTFSGLNPSGRYSFKGGAVRGNSAQTNRWTKVELQGALSFNDAHSAQVLTQNQLSSLASNQVVVSFGRNNTVTSGDMVDWEEIDAGGDGMISIVCSHFTNNVPNSGASGPSAYAITGIRLESLPQGPPQIVTQPVNQVIYSGESATFSVRAVGTSPLSYQWYRNDAIIESATGAVYTILAPTPAENGVYYVAISNLLGSATSSNVVLTVSDSTPVILRQPQDQTVTAPATATFSVSATGSKPLSFQWYRNGEIIASATNVSYTTPPTAFSETGVRFSVRMVNAFGTTVSSNAILIVAMPPAIILPYTNSWRFFTNGTDLGTSWRAVNYDDSSWPRGPGWLGLEDNTAITPYMKTFFPTLNDSTGNPIITWYFRTHFNLPFTPGWLVLVSSNYVDDGAVFYLNGQEFSRSNLQENIAISYRTMAQSATFEAPSSIFTNVLPRALLNQGDNVLAVEVHQVIPSSTDIVFGMGLTAFFVPPTPLAITRDPEDRAVTELTSTTFTVGLTGAPVNLQWFKWIDGSPAVIEGATKESLVLTNVSFADAGYYFVVLTNNLSSLSSKPAELVVLRDQSPPRLLWADGSATQLEITLSVSEPVVLATATNVANYVLTNITSGGALPITAAMLQNGTNLVVTSAQRSFEDNWLLLVRNLQDISPQQNMLIGDAAIPVASRLALIGMTEAGWDFYDPTGPPFDPPADWKEVDFLVPEEGWGHDAAGLFAYNPNQQSLPAPVSTVLSGGAISSYYRFPFSASFSPVGAALLLRQFIDDGLVSYLNGAEIYRFNMPTGAITALTRAASNQGGFDTGFVPLPEVLPNVGSNVLAAELHSFSSNGQSIAFGADLAAQILSWARGPVLITAGPDDVSAIEGGSALFTFVGIGASAVQWRTNGLPVPGAVRPTLRLDSVPYAWDGLVVSVIASNNGSIAISTNARLRVIRDLTPPQLLTATIYSNGIVLRFSEPLLETTATNVANFQLQNASAVNFQFANAVLLNPSNIFLVPNAVPGGEYKVIVNGVRDQAAARNEIAPNTSATVGFSLSIPFDAVWKYNTNGENLGTAWRYVGFDDTTPDWPSGPGVIADETAIFLPEPIRTPISRLVNGQYHYTFYFRFHFYLPYMIKGLAVRFSHLIDDGALMYLNGAPFYAYNMTNTAADVTWTSEAPTNIGDAVLIGPLSTTLSNFVAGDNVIAVEVHQNGPASSDITFGTEFFGEIPSVVSSGEVPPQLAIRRQAGNIVVLWSGTGFVLESTETLGANANWQPVQAQRSPYFTSAVVPTQRFYRLRKSVPT